MGMIKATVTFAIGLLGAVSASASPVLPAVANVTSVPASPSAGARIGTGGRVGAIHSKNSSDLVQGAAIALAVLGGAAAGAGAYAGATAGHNEKSVSP